jgi:hypothetical protein
MAPYSLVEAGLVALLLEVVRSSETSVNFNDITRRHIPDGCHLHRRIKWAHVLDIFHHPALA